jgi:hypothetical protein
MRIGRPARKHGVTDEDIWHAIRSAMVQVGDDNEDFTMLIGPAHDGHPLEIGIVGLDSEDPVVSTPCTCARSSTHSSDEEMAMRRTNEEIEQAAERFERWAEELDPATAKVQDTADLRAIAEAVDAMNAGEARLREAVERARARGRSWNQIAIPLGVSRQAARQRFAEKVHAS